MCYNRFFRQYIKQRFHFDYKFDIEISCNSRDNCTFKYDVKNKTFKISGDLDSVNHIVEHLGEQGKDIEIINDEVNEKVKNEFDSWIDHIAWGEHNFCISECFNSHGKRTVEGKILRKVEGEDLYLNNTPIDGAPYYYDVVKKWYEHNIPLKKGDQFVSISKPVYTYFELTRGKDKGKRVIYQAKEYRKNMMFFLPDEIENPKECPISELIPCPDDTTFETIETKFGTKVVAKIEYTEDFIKENHDRIFPCELADACLDTYWKSGKLNHNDYVITSYVA